MSPSASAHGHQGPCGPGGGARLHRARALCQQVGGDAPALPGALGAVAFLSAGSSHGAGAGGAAPRAQAERRSAGGGAHDAGGTLFPGASLPARGHLEDRASPSIPSSSTALSRAHVRHPWVIVRSFGAPWCCGCLGIPTRPGAKSGGVDVGAGAGAPLESGVAQVWRPVSISSAGRPGGRHERAEGSIALATQQGFSPSVAWGTDPRGWALTEQGRARKAWPDRQGLARLP